jgi:C1A family cysteine protease
MKFKGCRFDPHDGRDLKFAATAVTLPRKVDNRKLAKPIRDQKNEGSCVGFGAVKTIEVAYRRKFGEFPDLSERWAYEYAKKHDEWPGTNYEGSSVRGGLKAAYKVGVCAEKLWPYRANRKGRPRKGAVGSAADHKIIRYTRINGIINVKAAIHEKGVVNAAALVHEGWMRPNRNSGLIKMNPRYDILGGHAFALVGYGQKGFWVANSWGKRWGKGGFGVLLYEDARLHLVDTWTIEIEDSPEPRPEVCDKCGRPL